MPDVFSQEIPELLIEHLEHLKKSALTLDVIRERGYRSLIGKRDLVELSFSPAQRRTPGILIPLYGVNGTIVGHQYRPNSPREGQKGRLIKYENPAGSSVHLDIPPRCRPQLQNPAVPVFFTEGTKKVDALASQAVPGTKWSAVCAVGLTGVWGFKGKNPLGGTTILADFDYISFKDRVCYLVFDSDVYSNHMVRLALDRLSEHLSRRGAKVRIIQLKPGPNNDKVGVDDYLAQGHNLDDLIGCEEADSVVKSLRERSTETYCIDDGRICWVKPGPEGESIVALCNFTAKVTEDIIKDNGQETSRFFVARGALAGGKALASAEIPAAAFSSLSWVTSEWGMSTIIAAGQNSKDRLREAIQLQSQDLVNRTVYTHTGWREVDGKPVFLTAAGAIGGENISVEIEPQLARYQLYPPAGDAADPRTAIRRSLDFLEIADHRVTFPIWASMYLAPLSEFINPAFTLWYVGASGAFKSVLSALAISHFGNFDHLTLPASWRDTANQLEKLLFLAKDVPMVIDDWAPGQDSAKARELEVKAEHIIRAQGNRQGKGRMRADTTSRRNYPPRGILITSGEQLPSGHSHTARIFTVELEREQFKIDAMTEAQHHTQYYRAAMFYYVNWLREHWEEIHNSLHKQWEEWRARAFSSNMHPRLPEAVAALYAGVSMALLFAVDQKVIDQTAADQLGAEAWELFTSLSSQQGQRIDEERPAKRFLEGLKALMNMGTAVIKDRENESAPAAVPGKTLIGWIDRSNGHYLLDPGPCYQAVYQYYQKNGDPFTIKKAAVWQDLRRTKHIDTKNEIDCTVVEWLSGASHRVIALKRSSVDEEIQENNDVL